MCPLLKTKGILYRKFHKNTFNTYGVIYLTTITDSKFFKEILNTNIPEISSICSKATTEDYSLARKEFAGYIRHNLDTAKWFSIPFIKPPNFYMYEHETEEEAAERICLLEFLSCYIPHKFENYVQWEKNPTPTNFSEWTFQFNRHNEWCILAEVYKRTKNEKYAKCFAELLASWLEQVTAPTHDTPFDATPAWRTLECGIRMGSNWPYALHSFIHSPFLTDDLIVNYYKSVWEHGQRLITGKREGNWLMHETYALFVMGILYPEIADAEKWRSYGFSCLMEEMNLQFYPDGFHGELATGYHEATVHIYISILRFALAYNIDLPKDFVERIKNMLTLYIKVMLPDGRLPNINDGTWDRASKYLKERLDIFPDQKEFLWCASKGEKGKKPDFTSVLLPYSGFSVMRTGWKENSIWALFDAAPFGTGTGMAGHQHEDKLNLLIYANGKLIVTEGGCYPYDDSEMRKYIRTTRSHNTVRINGMDQNQRCEYTWDPEDINKLASDMFYASNENYDCSIGTYREGYGPEMKRFATHERKVIFIKKTQKISNPFFIVVDRLRSENKNSYEFLWHLDCDQLKQNKLSFNADGLHIAVPENSEANVNVISGQTEPEWQGWKPGAVLGKYYPMPTLSYTLKAKNLRLVTVFVPFDDIDADITKIISSTDIDDTKLTLQFPNGEILDIDENDYPAFPVTQLSNSKE